MNIKSLSKELVHRWGLYHREKFRFRVSKAGRSWRIDTPSAVMPADHKTLLVTNEVMIKLADEIERYSPAKLANTLTRHLVFALCHDGSAS